jgi:hypothetical protein
MISKKLIIFNITALLLLFSSQIVGNYLINYPMKFYWSNAWENSGFLPLFIILGSIIFSALKLVIKGTFLRPSNFKSKTSHNYPLQNF